MSLSLSLRKSCMSTCSPVHMVSPALALLLLEPGPLLLNGYRTSDTRISIGTPVVRGPSTVYLSAWGTWSSLTTNSCSSYFAEMFPNRSECKNASGMVWGYFEHISCTKSVHGWTILVLTWDWYYAKLHQWFLSSARYWHHVPLPCTADWSQTAAANPPSTGESFLKILKKKRPLLNEIFYKCQTVHP